MTWNTKWLLSNVIGIGIAMPIGAVCANWLIGGPYEALQTFLLFSGQGLIYGRSIMDVLLWPVGMLAVILIALRIIYSFHFGNRYFSTKWLGNAVVSLLPLVAIIFFTTIFVRESHILHLIILGVALWTTVWSRSRFLSNHLGDSYAYDEHAKGVFIAVIVIFGFVLTFFHVELEGGTIGITAAYVVSGMMFGLIYGYVTRDFAAGFTQTVQEIKFDSPEVGHEIKTHSAQKEMLS